LAARAGRTAERLAGGRFHVAVLGEFKRGKSTLINALLGRDLLPTGVLPLTAVSTEVRYGSEGATVILLDGRPHHIELDELADYVTEPGNPENMREVAHVEACARVPLLETGVVLVDTPGTGSVYAHNTEAGRAALLEADGAILVLSADAPMSERERELLHALSERRARTFVVVNRADHLERDDLEAVRSFVTEVVTDELGRKPELYCVAARPALDAVRAGRLPGDEAADFGRFLVAFETFVADDLVAERTAAARAELTRVGRELRDAVTVRSATAALDAQTLARRVDEFRTAADAQRQAFEQEQTLLDHDVKALMDEVGRRLEWFASHAPAIWRPALVDAARALPRRQLEDGLREVVQHSVHAGFEAFRTEEAARVESDWRALADRFRARTQHRVNTVRAAAADLFAIELPVVSVPAVAEEREGFFYLFLHVGTSTEALGRLSRRLLPARVVRRRLRRAAYAQLASEFDKHAGRARWDLSQRLDAVKRRFEAIMRDELDDTVTSILCAAARADDIRTATQQERMQNAERDAEALRIAKRAADLGAG
jgi:small GTP-binding protein